MNWEETVLSEGRIRATCCGEGIYWAGEQWTTADKPLPVLMPQFQRIAKAQAEASFKAGVRTVVDWVEQHKKQRIPNYQKEEWGIKEGK